MKCSNCGSELPKGSLICPRCGKRQENVQNSNNNQKNNNKKTGVGKAIGIVASFFVVLIIGLIFISINNKNNNKQEGFTHNITFKKDNLTVQDERTLRYREVPANQTFMVGSNKGFVEVDVVDENGNKANYEINKTKNSNRYVVKPKNLWDKQHMYYLSLGNDTYFTDEDMYQFNKVIYSIQREKTATYKYNEKIKNLIENPSQEVEIGDIVVIKDEDGQSVCRKVIDKQNGSNIYELPDLAEVFEDLDYHDTIAPNLKEIFGRDDVKKQMMYNIVNSTIFDSFVMQTYATSLGDNITIGENEIKKGIYKEGIEQAGGNIINSLEVSVSLGDKATPIGKWKVDIIPVDAKTYNDGVAFNIKIKRTEELLKNDKTISQSRTALNDSKELKYTEIESENETITIKLEAGNMVVVPDIKLEDGKVDVYFSIGLDVEVDVNFINYEYKDEFEKSNKEKDYIQIAHTPIPSGVPCVFFFLDFGIEPELKKSGGVGLKWKKKTQVVNGVTIGVKGISTQKVCSSYFDDKKEDKITAYIKGKIEGEYPIKLSFGVKFALVPDEGLIEFGKIPWLTWIDDLKKKVAELTEVGKLDLYGKVGLFFEIEGELESVSSIPPDDDATKLEVTAGAGISYEAGLEGEFKLKLIKFESGTKLKFIEGKWYLIKYNQKFDIATASNMRMVTVDVPNEGEYMNFGGNEYLVLLKNEKDGDALIVSKEGVMCKPYYDNKGNTAGIGLSGSWAQSTLREYLNNKFFEEFKGNELLAMRKTIIKPSDNKIKNIEGGKACTDRVFILSKEELELYFKTDESRQIKASSRALSEGAYVCDEDGEHRKKGNTVYWVRTPGDFSYYAMVVNSDGSISEGGTNVSKPNIDNYKGNVCVRPAMWVQYLGDEISDDLKNATQGYIGGGTR